jgi:hypothetical protein
VKDKRVEMVVALKLLRDVRDSNLPQEHDPLFSLLSSCRRVFIEHANSMRRDCAKLWNASESSAVAFRMKVPSRFVIMTQIDQSKSTDLADHPSVRAFLFDLLTGNIGAIEILVVVSQDLHRS